MSKLTPTQFNRISQYIKMYEGGRETLQFAWANTWEEDDMEDYYDLSARDIQNTLTELRRVIDFEEYRLSLHGEILKESEKIYQQWILINGKIINKTKG